MERNFTIFSVPWRTFITRGLHGPRGPHGLYPVGPMDPMNLIEPAP